jgi:ABC-type uncharacterized transport system YnjBCD substrate-binding protein
MKLLWIVAGIALATGSAASAQDSTEVETPAADKVVCKTKKVTGSRTKVNRTCMTKREWDELSQQTRRDVNGLERDANQKEALRRGDAMGAGAIAGGAGPS